MKLFSFLCTLCLLFGCSESETDAQSANTGSSVTSDSEQINDDNSEPACTEAPAEDTPLEYRELEDGSVLSQVGVRG